MTRALLMIALLGPAVDSGLDGREATTLPTATTAHDSLRDEPSQLAAFGAAVAITGNVAFVGETRGSAPGTVHIYQRTGTTWRVTGTLRADEPKERDGFGATLTTDGTTLLVGRVDMVFGPDSGRGAVHAFRRASNGAWTPAGVLVAESRQARASFGTAIAIAGDLAYVGAPAEENGVVYLFRRQGDGSWRPAGRLPVSDAASGDRFGSAIAVDGDRLAVGAPGRSSNRGAVFAYTRTAGGEWTQQAIVLSARV
ncbi:MAG: FG-GAP repeat protein, partial [Gemmatimonadota bacterium]